MTRRRISSIDVECKPDLTPMVDVCFQLITFFVMVSALAKDEAGQLINLPNASSSTMIKEDQIPDSLNINVDKTNHVLGWGLRLDLTSGEGIEQLRNKIALEANLQKKRQGEGWRTAGLSTTVILRIDADVDYTIFRKVVELCNEAGFRKYQLKARVDEESGAPKEAGHGA